MAGVRKSVYAESQDVWDDVSDAANEMERSVSWYLMRLHRIYRGYEKPEPQKTGVSDAFSRVMKYSKEMQTGKVKK